MTKNDLVVLYLSVLLAAMQWQLYKAVKDSAYNAGRMSIYEDQAALPSDGTCFVKRGCK